MTQDHSNKHWFTVFILCLLGVLLALFHNSFDPSKVVFSNDGPLGAMNQEAIRLPAAFKGVWYDLNVFGTSGGTSVPDLTQGLFWLLGPLYFAKWFVPLAVLFVGLCAWLFFRQLKLSALAAVLGGLAAALNSDFFSTACWGVGSQTIGFGFFLLALAAIVSTPPRWPWLRFILAGLAVGMGVMEAADIGAIFSLFVAVFVLYYTWVSFPRDDTPVESPNRGAMVGRVTPCAPSSPETRPGAHGVTRPTLKRIALGIARLALVAAFAVLMAAQSLNVLVGTGIKGIAGAEQTNEARAARWDWATQWSLPKREALSLMVPGLFGFRMDTPEGGNYWGAAGRDAAWDRYFEGGRQGPPPGGFMRYAGGGCYAGVLVVLVAVWAGIQSLRPPSSRPVAAGKEGSVFSPVNRKLIWFWLGVMLVSLLLAFGKHAPFYQFLYALPYFSTIRNPAKFLHVFSWALIIVFAYGIHGLSRRYLEIAATGAASLPEHLRNWWSKLRGFDRKWSIGCLLAVGASLLGWLIYASARKGLEDYLQTVQFGEGTAKTIASFSFRQVGWHALFLLLSVGAVTLVLSGWFAGNRAKWGGILLGLVLVADLARANLPWIIHWDYKQKYATNPVVDRLRDKPYEHRVTIFPMERFIRLDRLPPEAMPVVRLYSQLNDLYRIEWMQHLFQYYNIQCLDIIQMPRVPEDYAAYEGALSVAPVRRWELTNTRYLLGPVALLDVLNRQIDPGKKRFRIATQFDVTPKPGVPNPERYEHLTATLNTNGQDALFEFTGALPRAKLYANWQVSTNDTATLSQLANPAFDPARMVLVADAGTLPAAPAPTDQNAGTVEFASYAPKDIALRVKAGTPAVLLLNDKFDPDWKVLVDGKPEPLLRANHIMRGVYLQPGNHTVEFKFQPRITALYVSLGALVLGVLLLGCLIFGTRRETAL